MYLCRTQRRRWSTSQRPDGWENFLKIQFCLGSYLPKRSNLIYVLFMFLLRTNKSIGKNQQEKKSFRFFLKVWPFYWNVVSFVVLMSSSRFMSSICHNTLLYIIHITSSCHLSQYLPWLLSKRNLRLEESPFNCNFF